MGIDTALVRPGSAWTAVDIERFLGEAEMPARIACIAGNGAPLVCSLWYLYADGALWCATQRQASVVSMLRREPRCGFEIAGDAAPYRGVRGQGRATLVPAEGPAVLARLVDRYVRSRDSSFARWLLKRQSDEVAISIGFEWLTSWDFTARMTR